MSSSASSSDLFFCQSTVFRKLSPTAASGLPRGLGSVSEESILSWVNTRERSATMSKTMNLDLLG